MEGGGGDISEVYSSKFYDAVLTSLPREKSFLQVQFSILYSDLSKSSNRFILRCYFTTVYQLLNLCSVKEDLVICL
jgi:hypothetical protein